MKAVMNEAELYRGNNSMQKRDALMCLQEHILKIKWRYQGDRIIDIGCGDGSVTMSVLKKNLPERFEKLVGCDISESMVKFANVHHKDRNIDFRVLDIEGDIPEDFRQSFDHAFSFYTLHWIQKQEKAFKNILNLLAPGGDCLLIFLGHMPMYDVYRIMSHSVKWTHWLRDVEKYVSPYHDAQEPEKEVKQLMERIGFHNVEVTCKHTDFVFDSLEMLKKAVMAVNPFAIPKELQDEFLDDYTEVARDLQMMDQANNNVSDGINVKADYSLIVAYGRKS